MGLPTGFVCKFVRLCALLFLIGGSTAWGQVRPRVVQAVNNEQRITLKGNVHPLARAEFDRGAVVESQPMTRMLLVLKRGDDPEAALQQYLESQQDKSSPNYHAWLTPEEFGANYGPADVDVQAVTDWLTSQGFTVEKVYSGKTVIEFSGTARGVQRAFGTAIRNFEIGGKTYVANANDPEIPAALAPVVAGIVSLNNFPRQSHAKYVGMVQRIKGQAGLQPLFTYPTAYGNFYALAPGDFAVIYNTKPLLATGNDGTGQTIAIVGETNINVKDVQDFRAMFGLPANFDTKNVILNGEDPGITTQDEEGEADLDVEWSGAVAPGATVKFVVSASTPASQGIDLSALYIVEHNLAGQMSESYGICESGLGSAGNAFYNSLWQQAAAQGITAMVSAGDNGSAGCDDFNNATTASYGLAVNGLASTPYNVAVGGTDFDQVNNWTLYWNSTNDTSGTTATGTSAKAYIPEIPWNQSCAQIGLTGCGASAPGGSMNIVAGSGGPSNTNGKPTWQLGVTGMLNDSHRDLPDVSLFASSGFDGSGYLYCQEDLGGSSPCTLNTGAGIVNLQVVGGTSASSPAFAGVMALVNQYQAAHGGTGRQGNANYVLYSLVKKAGASCTSSATEAATCIFNDVTKGNSVLPNGGVGVGTNSVPCTGGTPNCSASVASATGVLVDPAHPTVEAWTVGAGYDLATGLGSVNVSNLATQWKTVNRVATTTTLTLSKTTGITHGTGENVAVNITVTPTSATGSVSLIAKLADGTTQGLDQFTLASGKVVNGTTSSLPGGTYTVTAHYAGDGTNAPSDSAAVSVTVAPESSKAFIVVPTFDANGNLLNGNATSVPYGSNYIIRMYVTDKNGVGSTTGPPSPSCATENALTCPSGTVTLTDSGTLVGTGGGGAGIYNLNSEGYTRNLAPNLAAGTHALVGTYSGDHSYQASTSSTAILTVVPATMQLSLGPPGSIVIGTPFFVAMNGTSSAVGAVPMGTLSLYDGTALLLTLSGAGIGGYGGTGSGSGPTATAGFGVEATITLSTPGPHSLTLTYSDDPNYSAVPSSPEVIQSVYPTIMTMQPSATTIDYGGSVTLTAVLTTTQTGPPVTGQIKFTSVSSGNTIPATSIVQTMVNGYAALQATATVSLQSSDWFIANYSGDNNYAAASASSPDITVNAPNFNLAASQSNLTITAGQSANLTLTVTPVTNINGSLQLQIPSPMQGITCNVNPTQIPLSGTNAVTATLTCSVPAPSASNSTGQIVPNAWPQLGSRNTWWKLGGLLGALALAFWILPVHLRLRRLGYASLVLSSLSFAVGCGGGGGGGTGGSTGGGGSLAPTSTTISVANTKVPSGANLMATVQVSGANSPTGQVTLGVVGLSYSVNTGTLVNGQAQFSYYLGSAGGYQMSAGYGGDSKNLPSQTHTPLAVVQTGVAGPLTVNASTGPTTKQINVTLTVQ